MIITIITPIIMAISSLLSSTVSQQIILLQVQTQMVAKMTLTCQAMKTSPSKSNSI